MNNVTHATDTNRSFIWEIYNYYSELGEPAYRIRMSRLLYHCDLYLIRKVSDTRWIGLVKRVSLRRRIKIVLDSVDIQVIEKAIGRKLADKEYFADGQEVDLTCHHYEGLTLYGVLSANIGRGMAYRADVVSIIPYGSLYTPVTYAPVQAVISEPLPDARKRLAGEMLELTHITYAPMGRVVRWLAVAEFEGEKVHFPIFAEHANLFPLAGHARLPYATKDMPRIEIIIEWNEPHHDLRIAGVVSSGGTIHKLGDAPERKRTDWRSVNLKIGSGLKRDAQGNVVFTNETNETNEQKAS